MLRHLLRRYALAPFAALPGYVGIQYVFADPLRWTSPAFGAAKSLAPMWVWGVVSLCVAAVVLAGIVSHRWRVTVAGLILGAMFYAWWGTVLGVQAYLNPAASTTGPAFLAMIALTYAVAAVEHTREYTHKHRMAERPLWG